MGVGIGLLLATFSQYAQLYLVRIIHVNERFHYYCDLLQSFQLTTFHEKGCDSYPVHFDVYPSASRIGIGVLERNIEMRSKGKAEGFARISGFEIDVAIEKGYDGCAQRP